MRLHRSVLAFAAMALLAVPLTAQERGTITGQVADAATMRPLSGAQIVIEGTNFGALANEAGRFLITNVPAGTHTLRAIMLGYGPVTQDVMVSPGETSAADFRLSQSAIQLDAVVVTATGEQRKRELGNAVGTIAAAELVEVAPINNMASLIQGRTAGVQVFNSSGTTGMGSRIRIRGSSSISLSNDPLLYVDGIRVDNRTNDPGAGGQDISRLDDFNPEDIESIEIIKGPAAATLYGTEAANGVIRITTKKGTPGESRWNVWAEYGVVQEPNTYPLNYSGLDSNSSRYSSSCLLSRVAAGLCSQTGIESYGSCTTRPFRPSTTEAGISSASRCRVAPSGSTTTSPASSRVRSVRTPFRRPTARTWWSGASRSRMSGSVPTSSTAPACASTSTARSQMT